MENEKYQNLTLHDSTENAFKLYILMLRVILIHPLYYIMLLYIAPTIFINVNAVRANVGKTMTLR